MAGQRAFLNIGVARQVAGPAQISKAMCKASRGAAVFLEGRPMANQRVAAAYLSNIDNRVQLARLRRLHLGG